MLRVTLNDGAFCMLQMKEDKDFSVKPQECSLSDSKKSTGPSSTGSSPCTQTINHQNNQCQASITSTSTLCKPSIADYFPVVPQSSQSHDDEHMVSTLKEMFPSVSMEVISEAVRDSLTTEDAVEIILTRTTLDKKGKSKISTH